jgi:hypothetical protein
MDRIDRMKDKGKRQRAKVKAAMTLPSVLPSSYLVYPVHPV